MGLGCECILRGGVALSTGREKGGRWNVGPLEMVRAIKLGEVRETLARFERPIVVKR